MCHSIADFQMCKVWAKKAVCFGKATTDITTKTGGIGNQLRQDLYCLFRIHWTEIHRDPIIRCMLDGSKEGSLPIISADHRDAGQYCSPLTPIRPSTGLLSVSDARASMSLGATSNTAFLQAET